MKELYSSNSNNDLELQGGNTLVEPLLPPTTTTEVEELPSHHVVAVPPPLPVAEAMEQVEEQQQEESEAAAVLDRTGDLLAVDESGWDHGQVQAPACRNAMFAILFLLQLAAIVTLGVMAIVAMVRADDSDHEDWHWDFQSRKAMWYFLGLMTSIMVISAVAMMLLLGPLAEMMIQVSLVLIPIGCAVGAVGSLAMGQVHICMMMGVFFFLGVWYAVSIWHRIPFAAANVATALQAIRAHKGVLGLAYGMALLTILWSLVWTMAMIQVVVIKGDDWIMECPNNNIDDCLLSTQGKWILLAMLFSFYWTSQVIKNILHTTIAGVVGTWWFVVGDAVQTTSVIYDSWFRSSVYSLGSICLGSLLVALVQVLQFLVSCARNQRDENGRRRRDNSILWCLLQYLVDQLERVVEYINQWAFVYVGVYGYDYFEAGSKVYELFQARGWSVILNDHLVSRAMGMMQNLIGIVAGCVSVVLGLVVMGFSINPLATFLVGWMLGTMLSNVLFQVVTSAVDTVFVCFAEAPSQLLQISPELSSRMVRAWRDAYPDECGL